MRVRKTPEFTAWIEALRDRAGRARILMRIERLLAGNPGQFRELPGGIAELKIDHGPGYRVYFMRHGAEWVILLAGGDKASQAKDIRLASMLAKGLRQ